VTDRLGAQYACTPMCTPATTTTTQSEQQPLQMINDTQPPLPASLYSQPASALTAVHQAATPVQQQSAATVYTQPACTQPSITQLLYT